MNNDIYTLGFDLNLNKLVSSGVNNDTTPANTNLFSNGVSAGSIVSGSMNEIIDIGGLGQLILDGKEPLIEMRDENNDRLVIGKVIDLF